MIGHLSGTLLEARPDGILVDVGGVGYDVAVPLGTYAGLPPPGQKVSVYVHTHVREDSLQLFGFASRAERGLFELLLSVTGIGPRVALGILSGLRVPDLLAAIVNQDARRLGTIPGVGKKLAERIGLELKEKAARLVAASSPVAAPRGVSGTAEQDAVSALVNLGYKIAQAESVVEAVSRETAGADLSTLLSAALRRLSR